MSTILRVCAAIGVFAVLLGLAVLARINFIVIPEVPPATDGIMAGDTDITAKVKSPCSSTWAISSSTSPGSGSPTSSNVLCTAATANVVVYGD
jgi:hypothetical protein